ncbi:UDP-N-acetylmuramoyl-L-alanyl-D-glutamate--2,6-diaminopimelate ligase [Desulfocurvibacter africanus]|uniref:UDP-N-acetylmuramoyl-L-alanyl-D-glutamate--2,6-diaminopimelate ligase n=1 Tax=Desulfocurvibacter africanus subsp. africanus str. Walvis Bay TaxID=690850 RepID=F3YWX5_DESAF|nr:UDP-N-acetylmuramoyl-L-alanyl-D-glutamate--2,6-diaminopimelate ligase [Desulfocurvibacter africanus]EGJ51699.1 UDP-N-acetylmuramoyl-L-alanyl-D-glutamate--2,6-diaminopimelate ligase [Desulfocurvibacter africanus subsp. africanus str. Walvis Bay]
MHSVDVSWKELLAAVRAGRPVRAHSGKVGAGDVFVAVPGPQADGAGFIPDALARGAAWIVAAPGVRLPEGATARLVTHDDPRQALGDLAQAAFGTAGHGYKLVGVTGTNGKTTISYILEQLFGGSGRKVGVLGTVSYRWPGFSMDAPLTTPDCLSLHEMLARMDKAGVDLAVMEVSSHALDQQRVAGLAYDAAVLTNLTQDHLDYHKDMETYFQAKARLFRELPKEGKAWVVNYEDPYGLRLLREGLSAGRSVLGYGLETPPVGMPAIRAEIRAMSAAGLELAVEFEGRRFELVSPLVGRHNAMNLLTAMGVGFKLGLRESDMQALAGFTGVSGRLERVTNPHGLNVFVDYAHTPDALVNVLSAVKALGVRRLVCVFGCGGNRDRAKRPLMGQAVCRHADVAVLTSDNPRHEDPLAIIEDVKPGLSGCARVVIEPDRRKAIALALEGLTAEDALVVAGKGHEPYQQIGDVKHPFSDQQVVRELLG